MKRFVLIITAIMALSNWGSLMGQIHEHESANQEGIRFFEGTWDEALPMATPLSTMLAF